jgi:hypothetical protein
VRVGHFGGRRLRRAPDDRERRVRQRRLRDRHPRQPRIAAEGLRREAQEALDDPILERMKADRGEPPPGGEPRRQHRQRSGHFVQLAIHRDPNGLEGARGRILMPITPRARADGLRNDIGEPPCRDDRLGLPSLRNCSCNRLSKPFLTIAADDLRQFTDRCARDESGRALAARRIHPHVERAVVAKRESARRILELGRRHAEIEQHAVDAIDRERIEHVGQFGEPRAAEREARVADRTRCGFGVRIAVDRDEPAAGGELREDRARVAATAERSVDVDALGADRKRRERFSEEYGNMTAIACVRHPERRGPSGPRG